MAFGRLERPTTPAPMAEINMTPLIDVMLVLLVIFMVTVPLLTTRLPLELPGLDAPPAPAEPLALRVALDAAGALRVDDQAVPEAELDARLAAAARRRADTEVHLSIDRAVPYGEVAGLIARLQRAGLQRIAFVAEARAGGEAAAVPAPATR